MWTSVRTLLREMLDAMRHELAGERAERAKLLVIVSDLRGDVIALEARLAELRAQLAVAQTNFEWARLRMNQLEGERSQLFAHVLKIPLAPMMLDREDGPKGIPFGLGADLSFEDMGDEAAKAMGVDHG